ncbi:MAG TPA: VOC family protein [Acidimicrobiia bacterium]|nr:VOC family protein [Acidimicrobiia bacterium]
MSNDAFPIISGDVEDVDRALAELQEGGAPVVAEPEDQPWVSRWREREILAGT